MTSCRRSGYYLRAMPILTLQIQIALTHFNGIGARRHQDFLTLQHNSCTTLPGPIQHGEEAEGFFESEFPDMLGATITSLRCLTLAHLTCLEQLLVRLGIVPD